MVINGSLLTYTQVSTTKAEIKTTPTYSTKNRPSIELPKSSEIQLDKPHAAFAMNIFKTPITSSTYHANTSSTATASENGF